MDEKLLKKLKHDVMYNVYSELAKITRSIDKLQMHKIKKYMKFRNEIMRMIIQCYRNKDLKNLKDIDGYITQKYDYRIQMLDKILLILDDFEKVYKYKFLKTMMIINNTLLEYDGEYKFMIDKKNYPPLKIKLD